MSKSYISKLYGPYRFSQNVMYPKPTWVLIAPSLLQGNCPILENFSVHIFLKIQLIEPITFKPFCGSSYVARRWKMRHRGEILPPKSRNHCKLVRAMGTGAQCLSSWDDRRETKVLIPAMSHTIFLILENFLYLLKPQFLFCKVEIVAMHILFHYCENYMK